MYYVLCTMYCVLCTRHVLCTMSYVLHYVLWAHKNLVHKIQVRIVIGETAGSGGLRVAGCGLR
jgi:hypothetical protein